ncbi:MAG: preprotein translocase subunit SecG [Bacillota bacterium]|nr:preprotein translocase subunit SecG [Bacillota bacterium]
MQIFLTVILIIASLILIASVLLQSGRSAGLSGSIGGGAEQLFGKNKAKDYDDKLDKITKIFTGIFFIVTILLAFVFNK